MKKVSKIAMIALFLISFPFVTSGQEKYYDLKITKQLKTAPTKNLQRTASCWANAGTALLEAEWMRIGKPEIDLSEMAFIRNAYNLKAKAYLSSKGAIRVDEKCIAHNVVTLISEYGMAPEEMFMKTEDKPLDASSGEMDAILRATLQMVLEKEGGNFTERWQNTYDAALSRYLGDTRYQFDFNGKEYNSKSFAEASGLVATDYILLTSDSRSAFDKKIDLPAKNNWSKAQAYNISTDNLLNAITGAIKTGFAVIWYGNLTEDMIFAEEMVAFVPTGKIADLTKKQEGEEKVFEPFPEKEITTGDRQTKFEASVNSELDYLLIFGISKDKNNNEYLVAKKVCEGGNQTLHVSKSFLKLNTAHLMLNRKGLPADINSKLNP